MTREYLCREWLIDDARAAVLAALDAFAQDSGLPIPNGQGADDADLPWLFHGIDQHVDRLIARSGMLIPDAAYDPRFVEATRRQMELARGSP